MRPITLKTSLLLTSAFLLATPAMAQTAGDAPTEVIVVQGTRLQNQRAIDVRRNADQVVDAVAVDDIGRLPDFNIGEALQRLPGIGIQGDQAEARFVTVRAMNAEYNYTTVDGVSIAVPDRNGRRVFMDVMPASLAHGIDVYKTFTPNLEGGAIGGIIDIRTASAFNNGPHTLRVNGEIGKYENDKGYRDVGPSGSADVFYSHVLGANDQIGIVLTANYYKRDSAIPQAEWGSNRYFYDQAGNAVGSPADAPYPGTGWAVPTERRAYWYHNDRTRYGFTGKVQYRTNNGDELFLRGFWNTATDDEARQTDLLNHGGGLTISDQTATSGTIIESKNLRQSHYLGQFDFERTVWALTSGGDFALDGLGELTVRANYSGSKFRNPENWIEWRLQGDKDQDGVDDNAFHYEREGDRYYFTLLDPEANTNFANFDAVRRQFDDRQLDEDLYEFKLDWDGELGVSQWSYGTGLSFRRIDRAFNEDRDRYLPTATNAYTLAAANVVNTDVCLQPPGHLPNQCLVVIDPSRANASWQAHQGANAAQWRFDDMSNNDNNLDYSLTEDVIAVYGLLNYETDRVQLTFGLRYEDTSVEGTGRRNVAKTGWSDVSNEGGYRDWLPSINMSYDLNDQIRLRAAASRSLGRPGFNLIAPVGESYNPDTQTLSRSNPDLEPRRSNNFDLGFDWYLNDGQGIFAANLFYKSIEGEIFGATENLNLVIDGVATEVVASQPVNNGDDTHVTGLEVQFVHDLDFIYEGLGFAANATFLDTDFKLPMNDGTVVELETMIGQPDLAYNLAVFYDSDTLSAKLAYNYQSIRASHRLNTSNEYRNRYDTAEKSLDFKASYRFSEQWAATLNVWNLTGEGRGEVLGFQRELPIVEADFGRAVFVGVSYRR
ncbi:TonB-dependent receptor [Woodsholea maritima]|uniref:TonB-dependent receptor n=1 Tax=Woodsholea maritima TaxID=240237 RepID=UPI00036F5622|nr:TonB-dependent receptor [Woodsholea maritima]